MVKVSLLPALVSKVDVAELRLTACVDDHDDGDPEDDTDELEEPV